MSFLRRRAGFSAMASVVIKQRSSMSFMVSPRKLIDLPGHNLEEKNTINGAVADRLQGRFAEVLHENSLSRSCFGRSILREKRA